MPPPTIIATSAAANPTIIDVRPPYISSLNTSTPLSSVPSQCCAEGGA